MAEHARTVVFMPSGGKEDNSLHQFICSQINPLLAKGWSVSDMRIRRSTRHDAEGCSLEVVLTEDDKGPPSLSVLFS